MGGGSEVEKRFKIIIQGRKEHKQVVRTHENWARIIQTKMKREACTASQFP